MPWRCRGLGLALALMVFWNSPGSMKGAELYYTNRNITPVEFNIQVTPTNDWLNGKAEKSTQIVKGRPVKIDTNGTYAIERQVIALGYNSVTGAWSAAVNYNGPERRHPGKIFDNTGWIHGTKSIKGKWGAYLWTLQNRIAFRSSETNWWTTSAGIPVAITKVMVGSLGDYPPMTDVVDVGPDISMATNFPGADKGDERVYKVDLADVYYQLAIPFIRITPREAAAEIGRTNSVRFTVTGTNIPKGVIWTMSPVMVACGAVLKPSGNWRFTDVAPGAVATNYTIRATSTDNTNFFCEANLAVVKIDIVETNIYVSSNTAVLHLTPDSSTDAHWEVIPRLQAGAYIEGGDSGISVVINTGSISTNYTIRAYAPKLTNCYDTCTVTVLKVDMVPDFNHDRAINDLDKNKVTAFNPLRFWINDDADHGNISEGDSDVPGHSGGRFSRANYTDNHVNGRSDLLDFFPVWLDLKQTLDLLPPSSNVQYRLRQNDAALKAVYTGLTKEQAGSYLTTEGSIYGPSFNQNACKAGTFEVTTSGVVLAETFLNKIRNDETKGILMMEGAQATTKPLVLEIWKDGQNICEKEMPLNIDGVEKMYRWVNLRGMAGGDASRATDISEPANYPDSLGNGKQFIFVHGYSVSENGARAWNAEMFKRLYQSGSRAMFTAVTWFGNEGQWRERIPFAGGLTPNYYVNVINAFETSASLAAAVNGLPGQKHIAGHSLGNMVVSSAINDHGLNVSAYFMFNAAVAIEAYKDTEIHPDQMRNPVWQNYNDRLWASEWYQLFDRNDGRHALTWRGCFNNTSNFVYNYYSSTEDVLDNGDGKLHNPLATHWAWYNQEVRKGTTAAWLAAGDSEGGWGFNDAPDGGYGTNIHAARGGFEWRRLGPAAAASLTDEQIRTNSFFTRFNNTELYGKNGSVVAQRPATRHQLLADALPALSNPTGRNALGSFDNRNRNLMSFRRGKYKDGNWPDPDERWRHSHIKEIAYPFNYAAFDKIVIDGGLK